MVPSVVEPNGHIPNLLQNLLLQVYGGLQLASEVDRAITTFREQGDWPQCLHFLPAHNPLSCQAVHNNPGPAAMHGVNVDLSLSLSLSHGLESMRLIPCQTSDR